MAYMPNQVFFHIYVETVCLRECLGNRVMDGWEWQNWHHRDKGRVRRCQLTELRTLLFSGVGVMEKCYVGLRWMYLPRDM